MVFEIRLELLSITATVNKMYPEARQNFKVEKLTEAVRQLNIETESRALTMASSIIHN